MRILSIDFDYFINCDDRTREQFFPDGVDGLDPIKCRELWDYFYEHYPHIKDIGVIEDYHLCCEILAKQNCPVLVADSHKDIWSVIEKFPNEYLEVVNIDHHHDYNLSNIREVDCANWVRFLSDRQNCDVLWLKREDSSEESFLGEFPFKITGDITTIPKEYDYIFICFSPEWTPPHLRQVYNNMVAYTK